MTPSRPRVSVRPASRADEPFLRRLYAGVRAAELAPLAWDDATRAAFLGMQFDAQDRAYREAHPHACFDLVVVDGEAAGRLYVDRAGGSICVIDISLLPEHRGRGIGSRLLAGLLEEGRVAGKAVTLSVLRSSAALRLYQRHGFVVVHEDEVYAHLEWRPVSGGHPTPDHAKIA